MMRFALALLLVFAGPPEPDPGGGETGDAGEVAPSPAPAPNPAPAPAPAPSPAVANQDAPITVTTRLTPDPSHVGDLLTLEVIVAYPRDHAINLPNGLEFAPLELVSIAEGEVEVTGNDLRQRFTITLQHFDVGPAEVPSFPITWIDPSDAVHTYSVPAHSFVVESLLVNEADPALRPEDPMISLEYPNMRAAIVIYSVLAGILVAAAIAGLFVLWRRRERPVVLPPPIPPHERALAELDALAAERERLIAEGAYQDYYLRLTEIAKRYLGGRFGFEALDRTTEEIQDLLSRGQVRVDPLDAKQVLGFLQDCDLVKFARLSPQDDEAREALMVVRGMVEVSMPRPEQPATEAKPDASKPDANKPDGDDERPRATRPVPPEPPPSEPTRSEPPGGGPS